MADLTITASRVALVDDGGRAIRTHQAGGTITAGDAVYFDSAGKVQRADADADATENAIGLALRSVVSGESTDIAGPNSLVDLGDSLGALAFGAPVFLSGTAGGLATTAGSASVEMGRVESVFAQPNGTAADKLLRLSGALHG